MKHPFQSYAHFESNEKGDEEVRMTFFLTLYRRLLKKHNKTLVFVRVPGTTTWFEKYTDIMASDKDQRNIEMVIEMVRQQRLYAFYLQAFSF